MNTARIELLKKYIEEEPNEPFNYYALGCELMHEAADEALNYFEHLLNNFADYLPTYYQAGLLQAESGEEETALVTYEKGIELAKEQENHKTLRELQTAYQNLQFEMD
jgi:tetratricopeptide (TPR) repeat protein